MIGEITRNVDQSSIVADTVSKDISGVNQSASEMTDQSHLVIKSAEQLSGLSEELNQLVSRFKI